MKIKETLLSHRNLPWILLALATAFAFFQIIPTLKDSIYHFSGDRLFHFSKELCMAEKISGGDYYFSVYPHNFGMPLLQLYPWVFDFMVVGLHFFSLGTISVVLSHNVISAIIYFSYPAVIFYLLRTFRFPKLICGVGALLSLAPISGWGASFNAYYRTGLAAQSVSNPLFPFTIILLYIFVHKNRFSLPLFLMSFLFMVSHLSSVFMWAIVAAVFFISHFKITKLRYDAILFKKVAIVSAVLFAVTMFCYVPMYEFSRSGVYFKPYPGRTTTPVFTGFNAKQFVDSLLKGEMFDNAGKTSFVRALAKEGQGFRWAVNIMHERFGLFTIFIALGLITCLVNRKRPRYNFFSVGLLMSAILLLGEDEVVIFQYLKLPSSIQYLRFIGVMDFFSVCVGAIGFYGLMVFLRERIRLKYNRHLKEKALSLLLVVPILIFIYPERFFSGRFYPYRQYAVARELTKVKAELTKYSKNYSRATFYKKSDYDPLLLSGRGDWAFILPMITDWLVAQMYVAGCHNYIPENEAVLRLFNIKYLLTETQYKAELDAKNVNRDFSVLGITEHFMLLENKAGYTYLEPLGRKPLLFITDFDFWSAANMMWFDMFGRRKIEDVFLLKV
jgi:hypothetical protein